MERQAESLTYFGLAIFLAIRDTIRQSKAVPDARTRLTTQGACGDGVIGIGISRPADRLAL